MTAADGGTPGGNVRQHAVFLVDDHAMFRAGVTAELSSSAGGTLRIAGEAGGVAEAVAGICSVRPDVVLLDVHMPDGGGLAVLHQVQDRLGAEAPRFLALSVSDAAEDVIAVIRGGARGYVTKTISGEELADAVRRVAEGDAVFSPRLAGFVLDAFTGGGTGAAAGGSGGGVGGGAGAAGAVEAAPGRGSAVGAGGARGSGAAGFGRHGAAARSDSSGVGVSGAGIPGAAGDAAADAEVNSLTPREREVLRLLARGYTYKEIAEELFISVKTVETHASNVLRKTQQSNRHSLARWAAARHLD